MRLLTLRFALLAPLVLAPILFGACKQPSQLFVGVITNMQVKSQLTDVQMEISRGNDVVFLNFNWSISDQQSLDFRLPGSINLYSKESSPVIGITVKGFKAPSLTPKVTRQASLQLGSEQDLFYRMAIVQSCTAGLPGADCDEGMTCIEGLCKPQTVDAKTLLAYSEDRVSAVECDSGTAFISTGTCGGGCQTIPVSPVGCTADQFCQEGTCYQRNPLAPRSLEFGELCDSKKGDACREAGIACGSTPSSGGTERCRVTCSSDAECQSARQLPDATSAMTPTTFARCTPSTSGARVCTFACDPLNVANSGCTSGTRCSLVYDAQNFVAPDCVTQLSTGGTKKIDETCDASHASGDCATGLTCLRPASAPDSVCRQTCRLNDVNGCPPGKACTAILTPAGGPPEADRIWGVCS